MEAKDFVEVIHLLVVYKITTLMIGCVFVLAGFTLFLVGISNNAGDLEVRWRKSNLILRSAAPGVFFAICGTIVLVVSVYKGIDFHFTNPPELTIPAPIEDGNQDSSPNGEGRPSPKLMGGGGGASASRQIKMKYQWQNS